MPRPFGSQNLQIPDPPFVYEFGNVKIILEPKQVEEKDGTLLWAFDGQVEINGKADEKYNFEMTLDELQQHEIDVKVTTRWITKMEKDKEKLQSQLEELQKKLDFLKR